MKRKCKGFTMVEVVIVIVLIAILATISLTSYNGMKLRAQIASVAGGLKKVEKPFSSGRSMTR